MNINSVRAIARAQVDEISGSDDPQEGDIIMYSAGAWQRMVIPEYEDDEAAETGGYVGIYRTPTGELRFKTAPIV